MRVLCSNASNGNANSLLLTGRRVTANVRLENAFIIREMQDAPNAKLSYGLPGGKHKMQSVAVKARQMRKQLA